MYKKILVLLVLFCMSLSVVEAINWNIDKFNWRYKPPIEESNNWVYQENADEYSCEGVYGTGKISDNWDSAYPCLNTYDGDWNTYGASPNTGASLYINYTKPSTALSSSLWQVKDSAGLTNLSLSSLKPSCWNYGDKLIFRVDSIIGVACLNSNTNIATPFGDKKIKDIHIGDIIYSFNEEVKIIEESLVKDVIHNSISNYDNKYYYIYYDDFGTEEIIKATYNHYFYTDKGYKATYDLNIQDKLLDLDLNWKEITKIDIIKNYEDDVWDLVIEQNNNFFANNVLVHNQGIPNVHYFCYDGSWGSAIKSTYTTNNFYEEAMWWNIGEKPKDQIIFRYGNKERILEENRYVDIDDNKIIFKNSQSIRDLINDLTKLLYKR